MRKLTSLRSCLVAFASAVVVAGTAQAQTFNPIPLLTNGFNFNIVIASNYPYPPNSQSVTVTMDDGPNNKNDAVAPFPAYTNLYGTTFFEIGLDRATATATTVYGMPHAGGLFTNINLIDHVYQLPASWATNNCLFIWTNSGYTTGNFVPVSPISNYTALSFLGSAGNGPCVVNMAVSHVDGTVETFANVGFDDWFNSPTTGFLDGNGSLTTTNCYAYSTQGRLNVEEGQVFTNTGVTTGCRLWTFDIGLSDTNSAVTNISITYVSGGRSPYFAVSGSVNPTNANAGVSSNYLANFTPINVTQASYNADVVVESAPGGPPYNATMDNGTNITSGGYGANTWFEVGWDKLSTNGFPSHGSTITSPTTGRQYQMPPDYTKPMAVLIDTNHQSASITPQNPHYYVAFSLLTAGASIGSGNTMTNYIILQHVDGVNESNLFFGKDWFDNTSGLSYAWIANARGNFNNGREIANNDSNDPRLFESEFQMVDSTAVTNILLGYLQAGGVNWTTYVLAVSATTNYLPVQFSTYTAAQNVYSGNNASFTVNLAFGSFPGYQWQYVKGGVTNTLTDGSGISGSATPTLMIAGATSANLGYYQCLVTNFVSTNTSPAVPLTLLTSTGILITQPGDPISDFGGFSPSPAGQTVANVEDKTLSEYVNYGINGSGSGFQGPIGFTVTPNLGISTVTGIRVYVGTNYASAPADWGLYGSNSATSSWVPIAGGTLAYPLGTNVTSGTINSNSQVLQEVNFANTTGYAAYQVYFTNINDDTTVSGLQVAEVQLLGSLTPLAPGILRQPQAAQTLQVGGSFATSVLANGPSPFTYQWYSNTISSPVPGMTNANFTLTNATTSANYFVVVSNTYGSTNSALSVVTVTTATSKYMSTVLADHPIALLRLDEGPYTDTPVSGVIAYDSVGDHDGIYSNTVLQYFTNNGVGYSTNDTDQNSPFFGLTPDPNAPVANALQDNYVGGISGINFGTPTNTGTNLSIEAWVYPAGTQVSGAAIVAQGWGSGGEQFALDTGGTGSAFRFYFRNAGDASATVSPNTAPTPNVWSHVVAVLNEVNSNEYIYVNGQLAATTALPTGPKEGLLNTNTAITIGARQSTGTTNFNLQFIGSIANVAIYNYALSNSQVQAHYLSVGVPVSFTLLPTNTTVGGTNATFYSTAFGTGPLGYQWYDVTGGAFNALSGQTNSNLAITNVSLALNNEQYEVVVTNAFNSITSPIVQLTVAQGPPVVVTDISSTYTIFVGVPIQLAATFTGSLPMTNQWFYNGKPLTNSSRITGAQSNVLTINPSLFGDSGTYQLWVTNGSGSANSTLATVTILPYLTFNGSGSGWSMLGSAGAGYTSSGVLELTAGTGDEARASFFSNQVYVGAFQASWTYQDVNGPGGADGYCFVVQNDPRGAASLGADGGSLAYAGAGLITPSVSLQFNIYQGNTAGGVGIGFATNGNLAQVAPPSPVHIDSGNPINVVVTYQNGVANVFLQDTVAGGTFSGSAVINIPSTVGGSSAYVGFTGADGGTSSVQTITNFQFISYLPLTAQASGTNLVLSWPVNGGAYQLQTVSDLLNTNWTTIATTAGVTNGLNQVALPAPGTNAFYRLQLQ